MTCGPFIVTLAPSAPLYGANSVVIKNVPPGKYTVEADHRKLGTSTKDVEVKDSDVTVNFTLDVK